MKANSTTISSMGKDSSFSQMVIFTWVPSKTVNAMVKVSAFTEMVESIQATGKTENLMAKARWSSLLKIISELVSGKMAEWKENKLFTTRKLEKLGPNFGKISSLLEMYSNSPKIDRYFHICY